MFAKTLVAFLVATSALALPHSHRRSLDRRAFALKAYADFQISGGKAGNADAEAAAVSTDLIGGNLAGVSKDDLKNIQTMREAAEAAESDFNSAISAAGETSAAGVALQNGKIKNKVLKLQFEVLALQIQQAQGSDNQDKIDEENGKLSNNISLDKKAAGQASTAIPNSPAAAAVLKGVAAVGKAPPPPATPPPPPKKDDKAPPPPATPPPPPPANKDDKASAPAPPQTGAALSFNLRQYSEFQISDGLAGNAKAEAAAVCVDPFQGADLAAVDATSLKNLQIMRKAAEDAETDFNSAIDAASGDAANALQNGKIKNKVLKLTCLLQVNLIKQAQGQDASAAITDAQNKLANNIATDTKNAGAASKGIPNSPAAAASEKAGKTRRRSWGSRL